MKVLGCADFKGVVTLGAICKLLDNLNLLSAGINMHLLRLGERATGVAIEGLGVLGVLPGIVLGEKAGIAIA
jgi:hypothetical protein